MKKYFKLNDLKVVTVKKQAAQLSQRNRAAKWVSFGKSGRLKWGDNILCTQ